MPGIKTANDSNETLNFASKASKWLDDDHLTKRGNKTNWKRQYKLRHNWAQGACAVDEIEVAEQATIPPLVVQLHDSIIYTADQSGLAAWSAKGAQRKLAQLSFDQYGCGTPASLAIDGKDEDDTATKLVVGFEDGSFSIFALVHGKQCFVHLYNHPASSNGLVTAVTLRFPYVVTMTATHVLSIYHFSGSYDEAKQQSLDPPRLLHSLRSRSVWPPLTTSLRTSEFSITVSIAFALPTYLSGWTVGIQEIHLNLSGELLGSRLANAIDQHYRSLAFASPPMLHHLPGPSGTALATSTATELRQIHSKPTSLSYSHPYLLVSHPDNTLTLYLVNSTADALSISAGSRLWGHTSSVSGAYVGGRGKAVSVSRRGDELRVWELEGGFASTAAKNRLATGELSVQLRPEKRTSGESSQAGLDLVSSREQDEVESSELTLTRGWVGFDDENVVVLKEQSHGRQALVVYDFT